MDSCAWVPDKIEKNDISYVVFSEGNLKKKKTALSIKHEIHIVFLLCVDICTNVCAIHLHARLVKFNFAHLFI